MPRYKDAVWTIPEPTTWDGAHAAVLMDIRDELQQLNRLLSCGNCLGIPHTLKLIARNTAKRKRVKR
jgi:hypothetical protein